MTLAAGTRLGPYEILAAIGAGGMGEVYRARDTRVDRAVALKVLPEEFFESEERGGRFEREARMLASLNHPGIAVLYSFEEIPSSSPSSSRHLLAMELVEGEDLAQKISSADFMEVAPVRIIPRVLCPVMVIHGADDLFVTKADMDLVEAATQSRSPELGRTAYWRPDATHHVLALRSNPVEFRRRIEEFLGGEQTTRDVETPDATAARVVS